MNQFAPLTLLLLLALFYLLFAKEASAGTLPGFRVGFTTRKGLVDIPYSSLIDKWSTYYDIRWQVMAALIKQESNFNPNAVNTEAAADKRLGRDVDSIGLGQILFPDTAHLFDPNLTREDLFNPDTNLRIMGLAMVDIFSRYKAVDEDGFPAQGVSAYNAGVPKMDPSKFNNLAYVASVKRNWEAYREA